MTDPPTASHGLILQPMVHVEDMTASITFYEHLGAQLLRGSRDGDWALLTFGGQELSPLAHPPNPEQDEGAVELNFQAAASLDDIAEQLNQAGIDNSGPSSAEAFGRQLKVTSPDGLLIKINEIRDDI